MSNNLLTISMITNEALMVLENDTVFTKGVTREYDDQFAITGAKIGNTLNIRRPGRFIGTTGPNLNVEDFNETYVPVTLSTQFHVDTQFTTQDLALSLGAFSDRIVKPTVAAIANKVDRDGLQWAKNATYNLVGTPGTPATALSDYLTAAAYLDAEAAPRDGQRKMFVEPFTSAGLVNSLTGLFNPQAKVGEQYTKGLMGKDTGGMDFYMDQNVVNHAFGYATAAATVTMNGANQGLATGWAQTSNLNITTAQTITLNVGDTFTIAGVYGVNPQNRQSYGKLRNFVVTAALTGVTGAQTVTVSPALIYGGQFQNVTNTPGTSAAITFASLPASQAAQVTAAQNILCHRNAFTLAMADLEMPEGVHFAGRASDKEVGMSIRIVRQYTINNDSIPARFDVLYGYGSLYPELSCRVTS